MYSLLKVVYLDILTLSVDENLTFVAVYKLECDGYAVEGGWWRHGVAIPINPVVPKLSK